MGRRPKIEPAPNPPPPAPDQVDTEVLARKRAERRRSMSAGGRRSTILTGPSGDTSTATLGTSTLLSGAR